MSAADKLWFISNYIVVSQLLLVDHHHWYKGVALCISDEVM